MSAESEYNAACNVGMSLANSRNLIYELLNKDQYIVPEEAPLIILDSKSYVFIDKNGKGTKHTIHIARRMHLVRNNEKCNIHKIDWFEGGLQLADISTNNVGEHDLTPIIKYIMVRLENLYITLAQERWHNKVWSVEQEFYMTRLDWVE